MKTKFIPTLTTRHNNLLYVEVAKGIHRMIYMDGHYVAGSPDTDPKSYHDNAELIRQQELAKEKN